MDYILLNADGSIKKTNFVEVIQQNNDGVNEIFVAAEDKNESDYFVTGVFVLPDGTASEEAGTFEEDYEYEEGKTADGWVIPITQNETKLAGLVFLTIKLTDNETGKTLYSIRATLTINETAYQASLTLINLAQYNALKSYIDSNLGSLVPYSGATENVDLGNHKITAKEFSIKNIGEQGGQGSISFAAHNLYIDTGTGSICLTADGDVFVGNAVAGNEVATKKDLPKKNVIGTFNTSDFATIGDVKQISVPLSNYIDNSDLLIITWANCFAICPIPVSGAGRVVAALWTANGEAQTTRIRYQLTNNNQFLVITLPASFQLPSDFTGYVINYKIV